MLLRDPFKMPRFGGLGGIGGRKRFWNGNKV